MIELLLVFTLVIAYVIRYLICLPTARCYTTFTHGGLRVIYYQIFNYTNAITFQHVEVLKRDVEFSYDARGWKILIRKGLNKEEVIEAIREYAFYHPQFDFLIKLIDKRYNTLITSFGNVNKQQRKALTQLFIALRTQVLSNL